MQVFANQAFSSLAVDAAAADTSLTVYLGSAFPVANRGTSEDLPTNTWFKLVLMRGVDYEICYVRTHASDSNTFTNVLRGQDGTQARAWVAGDTTDGTKAVCAPVASDMAAIMQALQDWKDAIGTAPWQIPVNGLLGKLAFMDTLGQFSVMRHTPDSQGGQVWWRYVNDSDIRVTFHGLDNVVREISIQGPAGKSAYQSALEQGFSGTEAQWIADLKAPPATAAAALADTDGVYVMQGAAPQAARKGTLGALWTWILAKIAASGKVLSDNNFTNDERVKLANIAPGAQVNVATNLGATVNATGVALTSSTGTGASIPLATSAEPGLMKPADRTALDGLPDALAARVLQSDVGTAPNQLPASQMLGAQAFADVVGATQVTRHARDSKPGDMWHEWVSNTQLIKKFHGFDNVIRTLTETYS